jgi:(+)-pinoresinol hydroxylase
MRTATVVGLALVLAAFGAVASAAEPGLGEGVYKRWCVHCHATGRGNPGTESLAVKYKGTTRPAALLDRTDLSPEAIAVFVRTGVLSMPPFRKTEITDAELAALSAFMASKYVQP